MKADPLLRLTLLAHRVVAFYGAIGEGGELDDISVEKWESWFKNPNATGSYNFDGYNVSAPFPPNETLSGWKATIAVANVTEDESSPYPGTNIAIKAPEDVEPPAKSGRSSNESDWHVCIYFWQPLVLAGDALDDGQNDDGSCTSFLSDDCLSALKNTSSSSYWNNKTLRCDDPPRMPSACKDYFNGNSLAHIRSMGANLSSFGGRTIIGKHPYFGGESGVDEIEVYRKAVRDIWTVIINWGDPDSWRGLEKEMPVSSVLCLRASNVTEGSENPNTGGKLKLSGTFGLCTTLLALTWLAY